MRSARLVGMTPSTNDTCIPASRNSRLSDHVYYGSLPPTIREVWHGGHPEAGAYCAHNPRHRRRRRRETFHRRPSQVPATKSCCRRREDAYICRSDPSKINLALIDIMCIGERYRARDGLLTKPRDRLVLTVGLPGRCIQAVQHDGGPDGGFLEKPFSAQALVQRIQEVLPIPSQGDGPVKSAPPAAPEAGPDRTSTAGNADAVYRLETPVRCPQCGETITTLRAVRLLRTQVNFTSTLPRRGRVLACPNCLCVVSAELTNF